MVILILGVYTAWCNGKNLFITNIREGPLIFPHHMFAGPLNRTPGFKSELPYVLLVCLLPGRFFPVPVYLYLKEEHSNCAEVKK